MNNFKILIIDDEEDLAKLTAKRLKSEGYEVFMHFDGAGAVEAVQDIKPDLILLDIKLPHVTGLDIFEKLRADSNLKNIPIIFFSASSSDEKLCHEEFKGTGFIKKPYDHIKLLASIRQSLTNRQETLR